MGDNYANKTAAKGAKLQLLRWRFGMSPSSANS
jgi:hypothetical protein